MNSQRPGVQVVCPAVSAYLMVEKMKWLLAVPDRTKVPCNFQDSLAGLSEHQTSWDDLTHDYYQTSTHQRLQSIVGKRKNLNPSIYTSAVAPHPLRRGHSECSYLRSTVTKDRRRSFPSAPHATSLDKYSQSQTFMECHKSEVGPTQKLCKNVKETQVALEQLEDTRQLQEPKLLAQAETSFLGCLIKNHNRHKKPRKGCVASGYMKQMGDLQFLDKMDHIDPEYSLQTLIGQMELNEPEVLPRVPMEETKPKSALEKTQAWELSVAKESESKFNPAINKENQKLWKKLERLAQDYYRVEGTRKQMLRQKQELKDQRWDSVIRGTSVRLAWREHKQRCPKEREKLKSSVSSPQHPIRIILNQSPQHQMQ
uniref:DUF4515 domain-containing protein n=1 Tax=Mus musculus TaxID=10090 RepID=Q8CDQ7_MOUSE|nr:unnamed protein product [Mus musculus]|eukprot:XP_017175333.1 PREDICTED: uncharacterized protein LOC101056032 [Mus musculus]